MYVCMCVCVCGCVCGCVCVYCVGVRGCVQVKGVHDLFMAFMFSVMTTFFRETGARGQHNVPTEGPILFVCAPHANQFIDPVVVALHAGREVRFLAAAKSMRMRGFSALANIMRSIPVERAQARPPPPPPPPPRAPRGAVPALGGMRLTNKHKLHACAKRRVSHARVSAQDLAVAGPGTITAAGTALRGAGTSFLTSLVPGRTVMTKRASQAVASVQSDTAATLRAAMGADDGTAVDLPEATPYKVRRAGAAAVGE